MKNNCKNKIYIVLKLAIVLVCAFGVFFFMDCDENDDAVFKKPPFVHYQDRAGKVVIFSDEVSHPFLWHGKLIKMTTHYEQ